MLGQKLLEDFRLFPNIFHGLLAVQPHGNKPCLENLGVIIRHIDGFQKRLLQLGRDVCGRILRHRHPPVDSRVKFHPLILEGRNVRENIHRS